MSLRGLLPLLLVALVGRAVAQSAPAASGEQPARAARVLPRGTVIAAGDILVLGDSLPSVIPIGWVTRRVIQVGEALRPPAIGRTPVVHSGSAVIVRTEAARVSASRAAVALEDGAPGDTIRVRLDRSSSISVIVRDSVTVVPLRSLRL